MFLVYPLKEWTKNKTTRSHVFSLPFKRVADKRLKFKKVFCTSEEFFEGHIHVEIQFF